MRIRRPSDAFPCRSLCASELGVLTKGSRRQIDDGGEESVGVSSPRRPSGKNVIGRSDDPVVTPGDKATASGDDIRKRSAVDADLKHPAVESAFGVEVVPEGELDTWVGSGTRRGRNSDGWRSQTIIARSRRATAKGRVRRRVAEGRGVYPQWRRADLSGFVQPKQGRRDHPSSSR